MFFEVAQIKIWPWLWVLVSWVVVLGLIRLICWRSNGFWDCCTGIFDWRHVWCSTFCDYSQLCHFLILLLVSVSCHVSVYVSMLNRFWDWEGSMVWWKRVWLRLSRIQLPFKLKWIKILVLLSGFENKMKISQFGFENKKRVDFVHFSLSFANAFCFFIHCSNLSIMFAFLFLFITIV